MSEYEFLLNKCRIDGNRLFLPKSNISNELEVKVLQLIVALGGTLVGKLQFEFPFEVELLIYSHYGERFADKVLDELDLTESDDTIANRLFELIDVEPSNVVLEPSAGGGKLLEKIIERFDTHKIVCYELYQPNRTILKRFNSPQIILQEHCNFLTEETTIKYDRIIAHPPKVKNKDIQHVYKMYEMLQDFGRMVTLTSNRWAEFDTKIEEQFRIWLNKVDAEIYPCVFDNQKYNIIAISK